MENILRKILVGLTAARVAVLFIFHLIVFASCYILAWLVRFEFDIPDAFLPHLESSLPWVIGVQLLVGIVFGFYRGWWRYVGISDVLRLVAGTTVSLGILLAIWYVQPVFDVLVPLQGVSRAALLIHWSLTLLSLFGARVFVRVSRDRSSVPAERRNVLIVGAGDAGEALAREIQHRPNLGVRIVGFVDDQTAKWNSNIRGIKVYGPIKNIERIAERTGAEEVFLAIPNASGRRLREIIHHIADAKLKFKTVPGMEQLVSGRASLAELRALNVEDLIRRTEIFLPGDPVRELFQGRRVLVTGAGGTIGTELSKQIAQLNPKSLTMLDRSELALYELGLSMNGLSEPSRPGFEYVLLDIRDTASLEILLRETQPEIVIHAAAHKHVPLGEANPVEYVRNNTLATRRFAELCEAQGVERFIFISSDKAINPTNVMGASKRAGEILLSDYQNQARMTISSVRFGNVLGSSGSAIPLFLRQIAEGGPVTVTHPDATRYFLRLSEAISLVLQAATFGENGSVLMLDMGDPIRIADVARDLIHLSGRSSEEIQIVFTGLRPGEKIVEEVRLQGETFELTPHPQIVITKAPQPPAHLIANAIAELNSLDYLSAPSVLSLLRQLIPEYDCGNPPREVSRPMTAVVALPDQTVLI
jgi:FlaA1/EpsC-like NDP-sugar epimerase